MKKNLFLSMLAVLAISVFGFGGISMAAEITTEDFGTDPTRWRGAYNFGWHYSDDFPVDDITSIDVRLEDGEGNVILKYTADTYTIGEDGINNPKGLNQIEWQKSSDNNPYAPYNAAGKSASAPFYQELDGVPTVATDGADWTVIIGPAFYEWAPATANIKVIAGGETYEAETNYGEGAPFADHIEASKGNMVYWTLGEAIAAAQNGETITLLRDVEIIGNAGVTISAEQNIILDLNGHKLSNLVNEDKSSQVILNKGILTIVDSLNGEGMIKNNVEEGTNAGERWGTTQYNYATNVITNMGTLIINGGTIYETAAGSISYAIDNNSSASGAILTINGGKIIKDSGTAVRMFANSTTKENTITVNDGLIQGGYTAIRIQLPGSNGQAKRATLNVNGGILRGTYEDERYAFYDYSYGDVFDNVNYSLSGGIFDGYIYSYGAKNITITSGTYVDGFYNAVSGKYIEGGIFGEDINEFVKDGFAAVLNEEGMYVVDTFENVAAAEINDHKYLTIAEAIADAKEGDTITLLNDIVLEDDTHYVLNKKVIIDGNNHSITAKFVTDYSNGLFDFEAGSAGSTIENLTINSKISAQQVSPIYFGYGFDGTDVNPTTINNVVFNGADDLSSINQEAAITSTYITAGGLNITNNTFNNMKWAMYFNGISNVAISGNTFNGTKYSAVIFAGDDANNPCTDINVSNNTFENISNAGYEEDMYSAGVSFGEQVSDTNVEGNAFSMLNNKKEVYYALSTQAQKYTVEFKDGDTVISTAEYANGDTIVVPANPTKNGYTFAGWNETPVTVMSNSDLTYTAQWTKNSYSGGGSNGGGGSSKTSTKEEVVLKGEVEADTGDLVIAPNPNAEAEEDIVSNPEDNAEKTEMQLAYEFAFANGITTMDTYEKANMNGTLTRIAMAKMLTQYAINVLGKTPDTGRNATFKDVTAKMDADYNSGVTLAYQLGIMGINLENGNFRPNDLVTRAEFGTALSRLLYGTEDGKDVYYSTHLAVLAEKGIITNTNASLQELRGYVMLMLMRSANATTNEEANVEENSEPEMAGIANPAAEYCVEQGGTLKMEKDSEGNESGICVLSDGSEEEEWEYFRANHQEEAE